jgi:hypothetical protein
MTEPYWRDLAAGLALVGLLASGERGKDIAKEAYQYADDLMAAKDFEPSVETGIVSVKKGKNRVQKQETA